MTSSNYHLKIDQTVTDNRGGITGAQINIGVSEAKAPDRAAVAAYLERLVETFGTQYKHKSGTQADPLQQLWSQTFYVRQPGQTADSSRPLEQAVKESLALEQPKGLRRAAILLADAGVGKTPAFQYILTDVAQRSLDYFKNSESESESNRPHLIPILIPLTELGPGQQILSSIRTAYNRYATEPIGPNQVEKLLEAYDCLLMLDDLDKVAFSVHQGGIQLIREFMDDHPNERYLISCRTSGYHGQLGPMDAYILDELSDKQVRAVLKKDFNERLLPLARNRAMLQLLITEGQQDNRQWNRGRLVQRMVWNQLRMDKKSEAEVNLEMIEALLEQLAYRMHQERLYRYSERQLMEFLSAYLNDWREPYTWRQVTQCLVQYGVMLQDEARRWRFCNRSTQAYFVAAAIYRNLALIPSLIDNASDVWWREPLEILVGLLDEPSDFLFELLDHNALVAAHCLPFAGQQVEQWVLDALIDALTEQRRYEQASGREQLVRLLMATGYPSSQKLLWQMLYQERKSLVILAIAQALATSGPIKGEKRGASETDPGQIVSKAFKEVIQLWQDHSRVKSTTQKEQLEQKLIDRLQHCQAEENGLVSGLAAIALGFIGMNPARKRVRQVLLAELQRLPQNELITWCIVEGLSQIKHQGIEKAAIELFYQSPTQRHHAVYLLGTAGGRLEDTIKILDKALDDPDAHVRSYAARAAGRLGWLKARERLEARLGSRDPLSREKDSKVLRRVAEALGKVGTLESIPVLEPYLRHEQLRTRRRVKEAIAEIRRRYELG